MKGLLESADEIPVTLLVALAYLAVALLTDPMHPTAQQLLQFGAARGVDIGDGQVWRLLTYAFVHGGLLHLLLNTYALAVLGPLLERSVGSIRFAALYVVSALGGGIAGSLWHNPMVPLVGGSGALFGMMGALVALHVRSGREPTEFLRRPGGRQVLMLIAVNLVIGFLIPQISNAGHLGGLFAGFLATLLFLTHARQPHPGARAARAAFIALFLGLSFASVRPAHRWDYQLIEWERTEDPVRRGELRRAFGLLLNGDERAVPNDRAMRAEADEFDRARRLDR